MSENKILNPSLDNFFLQWLTEEELAYFKSAIRTPEQANQYNSVVVEDMKIVISILQVPVCHYACIAFIFLPEDTNILSDIYNLIEQRENEKKVDNLLNELGIPKE